MNLLQLSSVRLERFLLIQNDPGQKLHSNARPLLPF